MRERVLINIPLVNGQLHRESMSLAEAKAFVEAIQLLGGEADIEQLSVAQLHLVEFLARRRVLLKPQLEDGRRANLPYKWRKAQ